MFPLAFFGKAAFGMAHWIRIASGAMRFTQFTDLSAVTGLPVSSMWPSVAILQAEAQAVRYRIDGGDPTAGDGLILAVGAVPIRIEGMAAVKNLRFIAAAGGAKLNVQTF